MIKEKDLDLRIESVSKLVLVEIVYLLNSYVLDNEVFKSRDSQTLSAAEVNEKIENYQNIGIQNDGELDIYCDRVFAEAILKSVDKQVEAKRDKIRVHIDNTSEIEVFPAATDDDRDSVVGYPVLLFLSNYIINGKVLKCREAVTLSSIEVEYKIKNYQNIGIQEGSKLDVYCDDVCALIVTDKIKQFRLEDVVKVHVKNV